MTTAAEQQPVHSLAAVLGSFDLHGKALDDAALLHFSAQARDMRPADEVNNLADDFDLHAGDQAFADDHRLGERRSVALGLVAHERPRRRSIDGECHHIATIGVGASITIVPLSSNETVTLPVVTETRPVAVATFMPNSIMRERAPPDSGAIARLLHEALDGGKSSALGFVLTGGDVEMQTRTISETGLCGVLSRLEIGNADGTEHAPFQAGVAPSPPGLIRKGDCHD